MSKNARLLAASTSAHLRIDRAFVIRGWSERAERMLGWSAEQAVGRDLFQLLGCSTSAQDEPLRQWQACRFLGTKRHRDGALLHCYVAFEPGRDADGGDYGIVLLDRVDVPQELATTDIEARYQSVVAAMQEGVVVQARDGSILSCNGAAESILGLTADQLRGRTSIDARWRSVHEDGRPFPGEEHPAMVVLRTGQPCVGVVMGVHKPEGTLVWIRINAQPIRLAPEVPPHAVVVTFLDITEERRLLHELRHRGEQMALVVEGAHDGYWDWDVPSGRVSYSPRWAAMLGYDVAELEPRFATWERLTHPDDVPKALERVRTHLAGAAPYYEAEFRMRSRGGDWIWVQARGKVVERAPDGKPLRVAGTHIDVSSRREAEDRMRAMARANEELVAELRAALERVKVLSGLLPVCAWCKSVRNDQGYWQRIEEYLVEHTDARLTHGLCPSCSGRVAPEQG